MYGKNYETLIIAMLKYFVLWVIYIIYLYIPFCEIYFSPQNPDKRNWTKVFLEWNRECQENWTNILEREIEDNITLL